MSCAACRFWQPNVTEGPQPPLWGECRRHPPVVLVIPADFNRELRGYATEFPHTQRDDWCGEIERSDR